ncbi:hypothetical protein [Spirosoma oryzicola]|uniref:hypothetical protein n=1 Tax=Spirosoma oryzicola TaxID=2898794 RepID=UPI001E5D084C|nr:hypothetical protein [Spirosoma oryzicola]UHG93818.1 hypothetical protein LQ777_25180 [Spirosoma oryzicola]
MERELTSFNSTAYGRSSFVKRISWSAVFAGVLVAIVSQLLLSLLGLGIGLSTIDPETEQNPTAGLGTGGAIWYVISSLLSLFVGGWIAGRLASAPRLFDGIIHGVLTWSLATLLTIYFLTTTIGSLIGGASRLLGGIVRTAGSAAGSVASAAGPQLGQAVKGELAKNGVNVDNIDLTNLRNEVNTILRQTGNPALNPRTLEQKAEQVGDQAQATAGRAAENPQAAGALADGLFDRLFKQGQATVSQVDRDDAVNVVMKRTGKSRAESEQIVDNWINTYKQAAAKFEQTKAEAAAKARQVADATASAASKAAIFGFFGLLIGVAAAGFGAKMGTESKEATSSLDRKLQSVA